MAAGAGRGLGPAVAEIGHCRELALPANGQPRAVGGKITPAQDVRGGGPEFGGGSRAIVEFIAIGSQHQRISGVSVVSKKD